MYWWYLGLGSRLSTMTISCSSSSLNDNFLNELQFLFKSVVKNDVSESCDSGPRAFQAFFNLRLGTRSIFQKWFERTESCFNFHVVVTSRLIKNYCYKHILVLEQRERNQSVYNCCQVAQKTL